MGQARKPDGGQARARTMRECLREFLTPAVWKQGQNARQSAREPRRWKTQPLVMMLLFMTWCCGDSQAERFETARGFYVAWQGKRKRPGQSVQGFQKALSRLPLAVLRALAAGVRGRIAALTDLVSDGFVVLGCDGSRLECPRSAELEQRLDPAGKEKAAPTIYVSALVHLRTGLLWAWRLGKGTASERLHLRLLLPLLPAQALLVCDAGYNGFDLAQAILRAQASFLIRMKSKVTLYTEKNVPLEDYRQGVVLYWPIDAQRGNQPPLRLRLIRVRGRTKKRKKPVDVWLLTNVVRHKLPAATAAKYYRWRWENEGLFRTYKRTLAKAKLVSRTVRLIHREAEASLLATQLLLALGVLARRQAPSSPRKILLAIRREIIGRMSPRRPSDFRGTLAEADRENRARTSPKAKREWPRRVKHEPPKPPILRTLNRKQKARYLRLKKEAA